jgi:WD40 repeat protein
VWGASSGACLQTLEGHSSPVRSVAFSHDSSKLASASDDRTVKVWDASSGACLQTLEGHRSPVRSVAFSHDSSKLTSASWDNSVKLWDASSGACLETLDISTVLSNFSFSAYSSLLSTDVGTFAIHSSAASGELALVELAPTEPKLPLFLGMGVSSDGVWIAYNGGNILWLPSEYRPACSVVCGNIVGIGVGSGRVWICTVDPGIGMCSRRDR